jgi:hypothetical protein
MTTVTPTIYDQAAEALAILAKTEDLLDQVFSLTEQIKELLASMP